VHRSSGVHGIEPLQVAWIEAVRQSTQHLFIDARVGLDGVFVAFEVRRAAREKRFGTGTGPDRLVRRTSCPDSRLACSDLSLFPSDSRRSAQPHAGTGCLSGQNKRCRRRC
jgi:hypothetical protein